MTEQDNKTGEAERLVKRYMLAGAAAGLIPLPLLDLPLISAIQLKMLHGLAKVYGVEFSAQLGKSAVAALLGGGVPVSFSLNLSSLLKAAPVYGTAAGVVGASAFAGASTYAIGKVFIQHFESGNAFLSFDPRQAREHYARQFEQGKEEIRKSFAGVKP
jgi:uncharacterized protein (DUF697 family)